MNKSEDLGPAHPVGHPQGSASWLNTAFVLFFASLGGAATLILFRDRCEWALLIDLLAGAVFWGIEHLESRRPAGSARAWKGYLGPAALIIVVTFLSCRSTLNIYFLTDDFGCLHFFHTPSLSWVLRMFHTDLAQVVEGESGQEIRPFYALYYMVSYGLWRMHPLGYHLAGISLHALNSFIVFRMVKDLAPGKSWRAVFAGLLFAVQPAHSGVVSWIAGSPAEGFPTLFYLAAFLCFMRFRATSQARYWVISVVAFAACLLCKEIAVTFPVMLVSYDLFRKLEGGNDVPASEGEALDRPRLSPILTYVPFALLLLGYLEWRRTVFSHFLAENYWEDSWGGPSFQEAAGFTGFLAQLGHLGRYMVGNHAFNLRHLLLPLPLPGLGLALGLYLVWAFSLWRRRFECRRSLAVILYFGLVWYLICDIPLLATAFEARHLYLPAVGPCIAISFLAMPICLETRPDVGYARLLGVALLVVLLACQLEKDNAQFVRRGEVSAKGTTQIAAMVGALPAQTLVIIQFPEDAFLPFALQRPFTSTDFYSQARIVEFPHMCGWPLPQWWNKTKQSLAAESAGDPDAQIEIELLAWDDESNALISSKRVLSRRLFQACVTQALGGPIKPRDSIGEAQANMLVNALAKLVSLR